MIPFAPQQLQPERRTRRVRTGSPPGESPQLEEREGQGCAWARPCHEQEALPAPLLSVLVPAPALLLPPLPRAPSTSKDGADQAPTHQEDGSCSPHSCQDQTSPRAGHQVRNVAVLGCPGPLRCPSASAMLMAGLGEGLAPLWLCHSHLCCPQAQ